MKISLIFLALNFCLGIIHGQDYYFHKEINFESNIDLIRIDHNSNNDWQIGTPQKQFFDIAYSIPNVIVTDTISPYPVNSNSSFYISIKDYQWFDGSPSTLSFYHKYDSDSLLDGGYIDVSYDGGQTWLNIIYDSTMFNCNWTPGFGYWSENFYAETDTLHNGINGFSGKSDDWQLSSFSWLYCLGVDYQYPDSMMIRFNFISDAIQSSREGWMIDNIVLHSDVCGAVNENLKNKTKVTIEPNPINNNSVLRIKRTSNVRYHLSIVNINGKQLFTQTSETNEFHLNSLNLSKGLYFYTLQFNNSESVSGKFIKN